ncbi:MAG TPA: phage holin family protein [Longimicrobiaceae bacterium]|nr:phage holin family protein [Longimicrobiaceae bacterium]
MVERVQTTREPNGATGPAGRDEPQLGELIRQLAQDSATLVRQEVALAKAELRENVRSVARHAAMVGVGAALALIGVLLLVAFLALLVGDALDEYWLGALIVGGVFLVAGGLLAKKFLANLTHDGLAPGQTIETLKEDKQWLQSEMRQVRRA